MKLVIVDASSLIYRAVYAPARMSSAETDEPTAGTFIFLKTLFALTRELKPTHLAFALDGARERSFRRELFPEYKAKRPKLAPADFERAQVQFRRCLELVELLGCWMFEGERHEADDVAASLADRFRLDAPVVLVTGDKDLGQLVEDDPHGDPFGVALYDPFKKQLLRAAEIQERWGVPPRFVPAVQALAGDSSDNVPGVPGVGPVKAAKLVQEALVARSFLKAGALSCATVLGDIKALARSKRSPGKIERAIDATDLDLMLQLVELDRSLEFDVELDELRFDGYDMWRAAPVLRSLGFRSMFDEAATQPTTL